ncbi:MAG: radical SAM protein [Erythrobacter sp.]|nr:radical SAM protein [Erythrobacter sp.]
MNAPARPAAGHSVRLRSEGDKAERIPVHVVWETTLQCNLKCSHCGSRAGLPRSDELSTEECLDVIRQLAELGTREVNLIGGEAYLRRDWIELIEAVTEHGMRCAIQTGGRAFTRAKIEAAAAAGLSAAGVSVDGPPAIHDRLRGLPGSWEQCMAVIGELARVGIRPSANTQINRLSAPHVEEIYASLRDAGFKVWQLQLTVACGNAADDEELLLQPYELPPLYDRLAALVRDARRDGVQIFAGNNVGYFGPHEHLWRSLTEEITPWEGCQASETAIGIEADGEVKGCPSLDKYRYSGGNIRERPIAQIWTEMADTVSRRVRPPRWGLCGTCYYGEHCDAGCTWTSGAVMDKPGNNPFCDYRARELAKLGLRERVVRTEPAPGVPFDLAKWRLEVETFDGKSAHCPERIGPALRGAKRPLHLCQACDQFTCVGEHCDMCGVEQGEYLEEAPLSDLLATMQRALAETDRINRECAADLEELRDA